ncbi:hypothetical protein ACIP9H_33455 [Streptomyces sp. NPDC088732]|uniref:hypothetical protein n=1 Tax=Streptomyces sp. NPDC088732 TaxID=3365879 RepID=UPI00380E7480
MPATFDPSDVPALRKSVRHLRGVEQGLPDTVPAQHREGLLRAALVLDEQADTVAAEAHPSYDELTERQKTVVAPGTCGRSLVTGKPCPDHPRTSHADTRRRIFNHLVAPFAGGPVSHDEATAMLDAHEASTRTEARAEGARLAEVQLKAALLEQHPKIGNPTHGCCAPPKACNGHGPECAGKDHGLEQKPWPCGTLRAIGITSQADADAVLAAAAGPDGCPRNVIDGDVGGHFMKRGALSDSPIACIYCGTRQKEQ